MNIKDWIRPNIKSLSPYSSARSEYKGGAKVFLDANENPYPLGYNRYPDPLQIRLKELISKWRGISPDQIMVGNGSDEIIDLLVRIFCRPGQDSIYTFKPGFGMYKVAAAINDIGYFEWALDDNFKLNEKLFVANIPAYCKLIFLCSPNNPTGNSLSTEQISYILENSQALVVLDEAYVDFSMAGSKIDLLKNHKNLVITQTFSKALGSAGVRIGMAFADQEIIHYLNSVKMPYNVSEVNQKEGVKALQNLSEYNRQIKEIVEEKAKIYGLLSSCKFVKKIYPSDANFYLIRTMDAKTLYHFLIDHGIVVRDRSNQFGCNNCLRITIGTPQENILLRKALESYQ